MAKMNKLATAVVAIAVAVCAFVGCTKDEVDGINGCRIATEEAPLKAPKPGDRFIAYDVDGHYRFVDGGIEYTVIVNKLFERSGIIEEYRTVWVDPFDHVGVPVQYKNQKQADTLKTTMGQKEGISLLHSEANDIHGGMWLKDATGFVQKFSATNGADKVEHSTTTRTAEVVYLAKGDSVYFKFPAPKAVISAERTSHSDVDAVSVYEIDGEKLQTPEVYSALRYSSDVDATLTLSDDFLKKGEESTKVLTATNVAYFLKHHVVATVKEVKDAYKVNIEEGEMRIYENPQEVSVEVIVTDNGKEISRTPYVFGEQFRIIATPKAEDKTLASEDHLKSVSYTFEEGEVTSETVPGEICSVTTSTFRDVVKITDENVFYFDGSYEALSYNGEVFSHAEPAKRSVKFEKSRNNQRSTTSNVVYDYKLTYTCNVRYAGTSKENETKTIIITWSDNANIPDDPGQDVALADYTYEPEQVSMNKAKAKFNDNTYLVQNTNRGVAEGSAQTITRHQLFTLEFNLTDGELPKDGVLKGSFTQVGGVKTEDIPDSLASVKRYTRQLRLNVTKDGSKVAEGLTKMVQEKDQYRPDDMRWAEFDFSKAEVEFLPAEENGDSYSRKVKVTVPVMTKGKVLTKASGDGEEQQKDMVVADTYQGEIPDEIIDTDYEVVSTRRTDGKGIDHKVNFYRVWKRAGKETTPFDSATETTWATYKAASEGELILSSVANCSTSGNGLTATSASGDYNTTCTLGFNPLFNYSFTEVVTIEKYGKKIEIPATFVIAKECDQPPLGNGTISGAYRVYPYSCTTTATLSAGDDATLPLSATYTRDLKVKRVHHYEIVGTERSNGVEYHHKAWYEGEQPYKDEIKSVTFKVVGVDDSKTVSTVENLKTTFNGATASANSTASASASNGVSTDAFSPKFNITIVPVTFVNDEGSFTKGGTLKLNSGCQQSLDNGTTSGDNIVYKYSCTVNGNFTSENISIPATAVSNWTLSMPAPADDVVPDYIIGAYLTIVPAHKQGNGYAYGDGKQQRTVCLTLHRASSRTATTPDKSAAIVYALETEAATKGVPTDTQIQGANWVSGYTLDFNSGIDVTKKGNWLPAKGWHGKQGNINGLFYQPLTGSAIAIRDETLLGSGNWGWSSSSITPSTVKLSFDKNTNIVTITDASGKVLKRFQ